MWNGSNFLTNCIFKLFNRTRATNGHFWLEVSSEQKSQGFKSADRADQPVPPCNEIKWPGNISLKIPIVRREVWAVAPSCWNQTLSISWSTFNFGMRNVSSISQYRSEFTVTVTLSSLKKYGLHIPKSATTHHTVTRGQCKGRSCNSRGLFKLHYMYFSKNKMALYVLFENENTF